MSYGANIERARRGAGMTQARLGERIGKDQGTVSAYENGRFKPDLDMMLAISDATGATLDELMRGAAVAAPATAGDDDRAILDIVHALGLTKDEVIRRLYANGGAAPAEAVPAIQAAGPVSPATATRPARRA